MKGPDGLDLLSEGSPEVSCGAHEGLDGLDFLSGVSPEGFCGADEGSCWAGFA